MQPIEMVEVHEDDRLLGLPTGALRAVVLPGVAATELVVEWDMGPLLVSLREHMTEPRGHGHMMGPPVNLGCPSCQLPTAHPDSWLEQSLW